MFRSQVFGYSSEGIGSLWVVCMSRVHVFATLFKGVIWDTVDVDVEVQSRD